MYGPLRQSTVASANLTVSVTVRTASQVRICGRIISRLCLSSLCRSDLITVPTRWKVSVNSLTKQMVGFYLNAGYGRFLPPQFTTQHPIIRSCSLQFILKCCYVKRRSNIHLLHSLQVTSSGRTVCRRWAHSNTVSTSEYRR